MTLQRFQRYQRLIDDWSAFNEACRTPLPTCIWANSSRISPEVLLDKLASRGFKLTPIDWYEGAFRVHSDEAIGRTLEYLVGLYHVQEEAALIPVLVLDPQPGERVLDLCAAPGNKTAQMALRMRGRGVVVANDVSPNRMRALRRIVDRLGLLNVTTTLMNGATYSRQEELFDRVLVDVPCSCEGTSRKNPEVFKQSTLPDPFGLARLQTAILYRALQLCKPGGRVVYSTCTYAPEENELVIQRALDQLRDNIEVSIVEVGITGLKWSPGLTEWQGRALRPDFRNAIRIYPHQNDTGGFFVAVLRVEENRLRPAQAGNRRNASVWRPEVVEPEPWLDYLETRFGIARERFRDVDFHRVNARTIAVKSRDTVPPPHPKPHFTGVPLFRTNLKYPKLSTAAALIFAGAARKNVAKLDAEQARTYLQRQTVQLRGKTAAEISDEGYVVVQHEGQALGMGLFFRRANGGELQSLFPKAWQLLAD